MKKVIPPVRGMHDIMPEEVQRWEELEQTVKQVMHAYGYQQLRTPVLEREELFQRPVGEHTDIMQKELFRCESKNEAGERTVYCMRPEGTVAAVRALALAGKIKSSTRAWYMGPMFRYERPQKGRQRQFHQFGAEILGVDGPVADAEMLRLCWRLWRELGLGDKLELQVNNLGTQAERQAFRDKLRQYLRAHASRLTDLDRQRAEDNPLRVLDSKDPGIEDVLAQAPRLADFLGQGSVEHYQHVLEDLGQARIPFVENTHLVRGLDYYNLTVFEWINRGEAHKRQNAIAGGGRYDGLLGMIGGGTCPGTGMAAGMERVLQLCAAEPKNPNFPDIFLATSTEALELGQLLQLAEELRNVVPCVQMHPSKGKIRDLFKHANASKASYAVIVGSREAAKEMATVKCLRETGEQFLVNFADLPARMRELIIHNH